MRVVERVFVCLNTRSRGDIRSASAFLRGGAERRTGSSDAWVPSTAIESRVVFSVPSLKKSLDGGQTFCVAARWGGARRECVSWRGAGAVP